MAKLLTAWHSIRAGLWFVPTLMALGAVALALGMLRVDFGFAPENSVWWLHSGNAADATDLLETLLSSMITMTTLAVSITMVVLTLAAGQLGPRLIPIVIDDRRTQVPLGLLLSTIVYLLLVLRTINEQISQVPHAAVTLGTGLVLLSLGTLLFFVHHLSRSIVSDHIIANVGRELDAAIVRMLPEAADEQMPAGHPPLPRDGAAVRTVSGGYIQAIEFDQLVACARANSARIEMLYRAGHHVLPGTTVARVTPPTALSKIEPVLQSSILLGNDRTPVQDLEFSIRQLVEIALRALSPGINDPFTALVVIDRLSRALAEAIRRGPAQWVWQDEDGMDRLIVPSPSFADLVDVAFRQIRQAGELHAAVLIRLREVIANLSEIARSDAQREVLTSQSDLVLAAGRRGIKEPADLAVLEDHEAARRWPTELYRD